MTEKNELLRLMDEEAKAAFGRTRTEAEAKGVCVSCGVAPESFRDDVSIKEWHITMFCQKCQDDFYGTGEK